MPVEDLNGLIETPWEPFRRLLEQQVRQQGKKIRTGIDTGVREQVIGGGLADAWRLQAEFRRSSAQLRIPSAPGYVDLSAAGLEIAFPLSEREKDHWKLNFGATLRCRLTLWRGARKVLDELEFDLNLGLQVRLRLVLRANLETDAHDPYRRRIHSIALNQDKTRIAVLITRLGISPFTIRPSFRPAAVYATRTELSSERVPLNNLPTVVIDGHQGKLEGDVKSEVLVVTEKGLRLKLCIAVRLRVPFFGAIAWCETQEQAFEFDFTRFPLRWGEGQRVDLSAGQYSPEQLKSEALKIEEAIREHIPYGAVFDLRDVNQGNPPPVTTEALLEDPCEKCRKEPPKPHKPEEPECPDITYEGHIDSAIWTGHYLAAEAFRYAVAVRANDVPAREAALERVQYVLRGIRKLFEVTKKPGLLARAALPDRSPIQACPPFHSPQRDQRDRYYGPVPLADDEWGPLTWYGYGRGSHPPSRDSYVGIMLGFACAWALVPEVRETVSGLVSGAASYLVKNGWAIITPPDRLARVTFLHNVEHQLAFLCLAAATNPASRDPDFTALYKKAAQASDTVWVAVWGTCLDPIARYYKFNLTHASLSILLLLEQDLKRRKDYLAAYHILRRTVRHHLNPYFNVIRVLAEGPEVLDRVEVGSVSGKTLRDETSLLLKQWLDRRDLTCWKPSGRPAVLPTQKTPKPEVLRALFPDELALYAPPIPQASLESGQLGAERLLLASLAPLPVHHRPGRDMDFVWQRPPFTTGTQLSPIYRWPVKLKDQVTADGGRPEFQAPGVDYLLAYWMGAYLQVWHQTG
jgi:hypothetical protein